MEEAESTGLGPNHRKELRARRRPSPSLGLRRIQCHRPREGTGGRAQSEGRLPGGWPEGAGGGLQTERRRWWEVPGMGLWAADLTGESSSERQKVELMGTSSQGGGHSAVTFYLRCTFPSEASESRMEPGLPWAATPITEILTQEDG